MICSFCWFALLPDALGFVVILVCYLFFLFMIRFFLHCGGLLSFWVLRTCGFTFVFDFGNLFLVWVCNLICGLGLLGFGFL